MKTPAAATWTAMSLVLALSVYGIERNAQPQTAEDGSPAENGLAPERPGGVDQRPSLEPRLTAIEPEAAGAGAAASRLTLAVTDGETLAGVLASADIPVGEAQMAIDAARSVYDPRRLKAGQIVTIAFGPGGNGFQGFEIQADLEHLVTVARGPAGFTATQSAIPTRTEARVAHGVIRSSLFEAGSAAGVPYNVTAAMIRAFSYDIDFQRDVQPGDRFKVMYNAIVGDAGGRAGDLLFAELVLSGKAHAIYGVRRDDGAVDFFSRDGKSVKKGLLKTPVDGARLTSKFGMRMHPILGFTRMHKGVDFGVPAGTPIYAAGDGVIEQSGWAGGYGRFVKIRHNPNTETAYGHLSRIASAAAVGHRVRQGEIIGYVGMTGDATGPHLHYEVLKDGGQVNPITVTIPLNAGLEGRDLVAFLKTANDREKSYAALTDGMQFAAAHAP